MPPHGVAELVDPRPHAKGSIKGAFEDYPHLAEVLPALGYSDQQRKDLEETIEAAAPDVVVDASPANLTRVLDIKLPVIRVTYGFKQNSGPAVLDLVDKALAAKSGS